MKGYKTQLSFPFYEQALSEDMKTKRTALLDYYRELVREFAHEVLKTPIKRVQFSKSRSQDNSVYYGQLLTSEEILVFFKIIKETSKTSIILSKTIDYSRGLSSPLFCMFKDSILHALSEKNALIDLILNFRKNHSFALSLKLAKFTYIKDIGPTEIVLSDRFSYDIYHHNQETRNDVSIGTINLSDNYYLFECFINDKFKSEEISVSTSDFSSIISFIYQRYFLEVFLKSYSYKDYAGSIVEVSSVEDLDSNQILDLIEKCKILQEMHTI